MKNSKRMGKTKQLSVFLTEDQMAMMIVLSRDKYSCPQSKSHALRVMIEADYARHIQDVKEGKGDSDNGTTVETRQ